MSQASAEERGEWYGYASVIDGPESSLALPPPPPPLAAQPPSHRSPSQPSVRSIVSTAPTLYVPHLATTPTANNTTTAVNIQMLYQPTPTSSTATPLRNRSHLQQRFYQLPPPEHQGAGAAFPQLPNLLPNNINDDADRAAGGLLRQPLAPPPPAATPMTPHIPSSSQYMDTKNDKRFPEKAKKGRRFRHGRSHMSDSKSPLPTEVLSHEDPYCSMESSPSKQPDRIDNDATVLVLGMNISHLSRQYQFFVCAGGVFFFSLMYGYLQELLSVTLCSRRLGLFQAAAQFLGYTAWSYLLRQYVGNRERTLPIQKQSSHKKRAVPIELYFGLSLLRAIDLAMTNIAMQYVNYPAKTLMKSSRVVFTMLFGLLIGRKTYKTADYVVVAMMVSGLAIFMHADANSSAVFQPLGIVMLTVSLLCDGAVSNMSESIMNRFGVGQDEFIFRLYSIATVAITTTAAFRGELSAGIKFLSTPGTLDEIEHGLTPSWSVPAKVLVVVTFSTMGFLGSSCGAAITKYFGALTMSITSTGRKATTLFLSFALFDHVCTFEHIGGIFLFISSLIIKSLRTGRHSRDASSSSSSSKRRSILKKERKSSLALSASSSFSSSSSSTAGASSMDELPDKISFSKSHGIHHRFVHVV